jgi:hypothetical protein
MKNKDEAFGSDAQLEKHAKEHHGLTLNQFKLMCNEADKRYEGQFASSVDKQLAVESFYEGFKVAIKEALEQPAQKPVKNVTLSCGCKSHYLGFPSEWDGETKECQPCTNYGVLCEKHFEEWEARPVQYTNPHQVVPTSTWQGLTDDEIRKVYFELYDSGLPTMCFAHAIEQALKEKNT